MASTGSTKSAAAGARGAWLFVALSLALYLPTLGWGLPAATAEGRHFTHATDELLPLGPLAEMHNTFVQSKPDRNYAYPWFGYFTFACAQAPYLGWEYLTGGLAAPTPDYPYGFADPAAGLRGLTLAGRLLSVLMATGVVLATAAFARELFGERVARLAAALTLTNFLLVYYSGTGNLEAPVAFWTSLGLVAFARVLTRGATPRRCAWLGLWAGLAMATKDQALVVFLPLAVALAWPGFVGEPREAREAGAERRYPRRAVLAGLGASIVAYFAGTGMLVDPARQLEHVRRLFFASETLTAGELYYPPAARDLAGRLGLLRDYVLMWGDVLSWPVLAACLAGLALVLRRRARVAVTALPPLLLFALLAWPMGHAVRRYALPLVPPLATLAAVALCAVPWRSTRRALVLLAVGWQLLVAVDLSHVQLTETRARAARWLASHALPGQRVEYFGHAQQLPALPGELTSRRVAGRESWEGEFDHGPRVLDYLRSEGPEFIIVSADWTSKPGMERSEDCPPEVWRALRDGDAGYACAATFEAEPWLPAALRPRLDSRAVAPPVRIFERADAVR